MFSRYIKCYIFERDPSQSSNFIQPGHTSGVLLFIYDQSGCTFQFSWDGLSLCLPSWHNYQQSLISFSKVSSFGFFWTINYMATLLWPMIILMDRSVFSDQPVPMPYQFLNIFNIRYTYKVIKAQKGDMISPSTN